MVHRDGPVLGIETEAQPLHARRADRIEQGVVGAGQHHLHRALHGLGGQGRRHGIVAVEPAPEPAADEVGPHDDLLWSLPQSFGDDRQDEALGLVAGMDLENAFRLEREGINGFELEVEHPGGRVGGLDRHRGGREGGVDVAAARVEDGAGVSVSDQPFCMIAQVPVGDGRGLAVLPGDAHEIGGADGRIVGLGHHHDPSGHGAGRVVEHEAAKIALHGPGGAVVDGDDGRAVAGRRHLGTRIDHPVHRGVDAVDGFAPGLGRDVERLDRAADQRPFVRRLDGQRREVVRAEAARQVAAPDDLVIADRLPVGLDAALARDAGFRCDAEQLRGFRDERDAAGRAGAAEQGIGRPDRGAGSGDHRAPLRVRVDADDPHLVPIGLELVGEDAGQRRADVLAHLGLRHVDPDEALAVDAEPDRRLESRARGRRTCGGRQEGRRTGRTFKAEHHARRKARDEEGTARQVGRAGVRQRPVHGIPASAV